MLVCFLVNAFGSKYLDLINKICIYWTAASVVIILVTLLAMKDNLRSGEFVFAHYDASESGWPSGWAFFVGLLQAAYTLTGYGLVASMCEEVQNPAREVPKAMVLSVAAAGITGVVYLVPVLFAMPDIQELLKVASGQPIGEIFKQATGSAGGGFGLLFLLLGILFFAGTGALTASSRCTYAFARDGAIPGSRWLGTTNKKLDIPLWGLVLSTVVDCLLGLIYFGSTAAFNSFTGVATICLSTGYGLPILVSLLRGRKLVRHSTFSLGKFGYLINIICICWICLAIVLFCMPVSLPVSTHNSSLPFISPADFTLTGHGIKHELRLCSLDGFRGDKSHLVRRARQETFHRTTRRSRRRPDARGQGLPRHGWRTWPRKRNDSQRAIESLEKGVAAESTRLVFIVLYSCRILISVPHHVIDICVLP